ncbi:VPS10 domain-containing protein [Telluribacter sp. SYSU D00476]|uniref:WD40/YVTN/BNR-like repeat-containing protein n=1 Tax=Telluribacter sp. SYSU D00476 TaxID=2811430 RepID=UPI001FF54074|nr:glycosyl hydrolase [Telluribacter sp. SYSU D00476]
MKKTLLFLGLAALPLGLSAQKKKAKTPTGTNTTTSPSIANYDTLFKAVKWRNIGPYRGGRSVAASGVIGDPLTYYMGTTGGGLWKTTDAGVSWQNISDGFFKTGSVGAVTVSESDPNVVYVGMGEHAPRGVMTSHGDGVYKSTDAGKTWTKLGLDLTRHIARISVHPTDPDIVFVAAQGALHGPSQERGIYKSVDGGKTWKKVLYVDENTGCADLSMDMTNPRILYAAMWDHRRLPWQMVSGGKGSGMYKSTDGGETWNQIQKGLPKELGKMGISVSRANPERVYAVVESDTEKEQGGVFRSDDAGKSWTRISKDHRTVQRAWYYIEIFADPNNEDVVYVMNSPALKSIDGGKTFSRVFTTTHGDYHDLWINPKNSKNLVSANDGGAAVSFNGGTTFSLQNGMPTAQFYRISADNLFPYRVYAGQQDNTSVMIASRTTNGGGITDKDWEASAGGESAFLAFDPDAPRYVMGGSYQGTIELLDQQNKEGKGVMVSPIQYQSVKAKDMKYRFNWNAPIIYSQREKAYYHAGNVVFKTTDLGKTWGPISPDLTRGDTTKLGLGGAPYTNEGAGGENYATISYLLESPQEAGVLWAGSDDGLVHITRDNGKTWTNVTPAGLEETLINSIEVSPHDKATAYIATTRYKVNDFRPSIYKTTDYGKTWTKITNGIPDGAFTRVVREDTQRKGLLFAGTETGMYVSFNGGNQWAPMQLNLPVTPITDLKVHQNDLIAATSGRSFWILDDLAPFRQYSDKQSKDSLLVYTPEDTYRVSGRSTLDKVEEGEDASIGVGSSGSVGTNPATGVVLYYQLPAKVDTSLTLTMEVLDAKGEVVREYSSKKDEEFEEYPGGPSPDPTLPIKAGLNRFVWDLRAETLPGVPKVFIEGSYDGRKMAPGAYKARFTYGKQSHTVAFNVLPDPRINATAADYEDQQKTMIAIENGVKDIHESVLKMRKVRKQVSEVVDLLKDKADMKEVTDQGKALVKKLSAWEDKLVQNKSQSNDDVINFLNMLSADYIFVRGELDTNVPFVTNGQKQRVAELDAQWQKLKSEMNDIVSKEVAAFNTLTKQKGIEKVIVSL